MGRTARPSPCPCRHGTKASACHGPPARPMTRHGHGTAKGEARWPARLPHPAASPIAMAIAVAAGHPRCVAPSSSSRPHTRSPGRRRTSSLWARGRAPPGRRRTGELCPKPASPPPRAPHQSGAYAPAPPSPTDATRRHHRPSSTLGSAPKLRRRICHTVTRSAAGSPCCLRHAVLSARHDGPCAVPWGEGLVHGTDKHGAAARRGTTQCRHGTMAIYSASSRRRPSRPPPLGPACGLRSSASSPAVELRLRPNPHLRPATGAAARQHLSPCGSLCHITSSPRRKREKSKTWWDPFGMGGRN
jgi:hypothetical protein